MRASSVCSIEKGYTKVSFPARNILTRPASYVNIEFMRYVIVFSALLAIETFWFLVMRKRNRFMSVVRTNAALKRHVDEQTEPRR
jgi:hypothetical protein